MSSSKYWRPLRTFKAFYYSAMWHANRIRNLNEILWTKCFFLSEFFSRMFAVRKIDWKGSSLSIKQFSLLLPPAQVHQHSQVTIVERWRIIAGSTELNLEPLGFELRSRTTEPRVLKNSMILLAVSVFRIRENEFHSLRISFLQVSEKVVS